MSHDPLDIIAESYRGIQESTQVIAQATARMVETQRLLVWFQGVAVILMGFSLLFTGYVVWQHFTQGQEHAALTQALLALLQRMPAQ
jgi:hypothetical protein